MAKPAVIELTSGQREKLDTIGRQMALGGTLPSLGHKGPLTVGEARLVELGLATLDGQRLKITAKGREFLKGDA